MEENTQEIVKENNKDITKAYLLGMLSGSMIALVLAGIVIIFATIYPAIRAKKTVTEIERNTESKVETGNRELVNEKTIKKIAAIEGIINKYYFEDYTTDQLEEGLYDGMIASLEDKYARYYTTEEVKKLDAETGGYFCGIGATVQQDKETGLCAIVEPIEGSPAWEVGLEPGDLIYEVDGKSISGMELSEVVKLLRGEEGTLVHVTIIRDGESEALEYDIVRGKVESTSVGYEMLEDSIGHIGISEFDDHTADQFVDALATLKGDGAKGIIIDVRGNLGGNLSAVVAICKNILPEGMIVYTMDKYGNKDEYKSDGSHVLDLPIVVLVNRYSASASEILTGAIKDHKLGTIVGETTYGKGVVQKIVSLSDGSALKLTAEKYYTPNGVCINGSGIEPDIEVELDYDNFKKNGIDNQLNVAIEEIKKLME